MVKRSTRFFAVFLLLLFGNILIGYSQIDSEDDSRGLRPREYAEKLHNKFVAKRKKSAGSHNKAASASYKAVDNEEVKLEAGIDVGFTIWALLEADAASDPSMVEIRRIAVRQKDKVVEKQINAIPKRVASGSEFSDGDLIRFSLELPVEGYIYIIDREQYLDGSYSDPYLIFPSRADAGLTDRAVPGKLLFIPDQTGSFKLERYLPNSPEKVAEVFTLVISPTPLKELPALESEEPRKLDSAKFAQWLQEWSGPAWRFEQQRSIGLAITKAEKDANVAGGQSLSEDDNLPQTIYHVAHKPGRPLILTIPARIRKQVN